MRRPEAWAGLAKVALQQDQPDAALAAIQKARALDGEGAYWKLLHGNVLVQLGRDSEALPLLKEGQGSMPSIVDPWSQGTQSTRTRDQELLERGAAMESAGDYSGAVRTYRELIAMRPGEARLPLRLARTLLKAGRNDEALKVTDETLENFPTQLELLVLRGALLNKAGQSQGAWQCATQALHHHPDRPDGYLFKASLLTGENRLPEAQAAAEKALELAPNDLRARETLGSVLVRQQLIDQAIEVLEPTLYADGARPPLSYFQLLGTCLEFRGHSNRLQKMVDYAREIHGDQVFRRN